MAEYFRISLRPNSEIQVEIRADGSKLWWEKSKSMILEFKPGFMGLHAPAVLMWDIDDMEVKKVTGFD